MATQQVAFRAIEAEISVQYCLFRSENKRFVPVAGKGLGGDVEAVEKCLIGRILALRRLIS